MIHSICKKRKRERGAALVESAVVVPVLIVCLGALMFAGMLRYRKQSQQQLARQTVFTYATRNCEVASPYPVQSGQSAAGQLDGKPPSGATGGDDRAEKALDSSYGDQSMGQVSRSFGTASGGPPPFQYTRSFAYVSGSRQVSGHSFYFCNEHTYPALKFFDYAKNFAGNFLPSPF